MIAALRSRRRTVLAVTLTAVAVALLVVLAAPPRLDAEKSKDVRFVSVAATRLLAKPMAFSATVARLDAGEAVTVVAESAGYLQVEADGKSGWIPALSVQKEKPAIGYSARKNTDTSAEEVAAATKGFNSDVEEEYSKQNPKLDYHQLDRLEGRTAIKDPVTTLERFRKEGKLGEFAGDKE